MACRADSLLLKSRQSCGTSRANFVLSQNPKVLVRARAGLLPLPIGSLSFQGRRDRYSTAGDVERARER